MPNLRLDRLQFHLESSQYDPTRNQTQPSNFMVHAQPTVTLSAIDHKADNVK